MEAASLRWTACIHEAGHAIANWYLCSGIDHVYVLSAEDFAQGTTEPRLGGCAARQYCLNWDPRMPPGGEENGRVREIALNRAVVVSAGCFAEAKAFGGNWAKLLDGDRSPDGDQAQLRSELRGYNEVTFQDLLVETQRRLEMIFETTGVWDAVLLLAKALEAEDTVTGAQAVSIIEECAGPHPLPPIFPHTA